MVHSCRDIAVAVAAFAVSLHGLQSPSPQPSPEHEDTIQFRSGVELIHVTATVSDVDGRFVAGLRQDDFLVYEDDQPQTVTQFSSERVPVSLGIALDTSQSMSGETIREARNAIDALLAELAEPPDEFFLYQRMSVRASTAPPLDELEERVYRRCDDAKEHRDGADGLPARESD